ncbi:MAG: ABC transporter ATP-binding protein [Nocardioidaceae bacterium]|nr:ABC transporter ATP-binding protein [Nocardioidaceae bacterium]
MTTVPPVLDVRDLTVDVRAAHGPVRLLHGVSLQLRRGERVALVGESGSGKSVFARSLIRLDDAMTVGGSVQFDGADLVTASERRLREVRGQGIGLVFQDPLSSLDPVKRIGDQVMEPLVIRGVPKREARERARDVLDRLGVPNAARRMDAYPHEFSGGMRQRVCLAMAIVAEPAVLIADEPTTALDVRVQEQVMQLIEEISADGGPAVLLITHDLGLVAGFAHRVAVMYAGRLIEVAGVDDLYADPRHPYTRGLLDSVPRIDLHEGDLTAIPGTPASPFHPVGGCPFHPRCAAALEHCAHEEPLLTVLPSPMPFHDRQVACHRAGEIVHGRTA